MRLLRRTREYEKRFENIQKLERNITLMRFSFSEVNNLVNIFTQKGNLFVLDFIQIESEIVKMTSNIYFLKLVLLKTIFGIYRGKKKNILV